MFGATTVLSCEALTRAENRALQLSPACPQEAPACPATPMGNRKVRAPNVGVAGCVKGVTEIQATPNCRLASVVPLRRADEAVDVS